MRASILFVILCVTCVAFFFSQRAISHITFNEKITPKSIVKLKQQLDNARYGDVIYLTINSVGGDVTAGVKIVASLKYTKAKVVMRVNSLAASMAAIWLGYADELQVQPYALIVYHTYRIKKGYVHKVLTTRSATGEEKYILKTSQIIIKECCSKFLIDKEYDEIFIEGKDIILTGKEFNRRIDFDKNTKAMKKEDNSITFQRFIYK